MHAGLDDAGIEELEEDSAPDLDTRLDEIWSGYEDEKARINVRHDKRLRELHDEFKQQLAKRRAEMRRALQPIPFLTVKIGGLPISLSFDPLALYEATSRAARTMAENKRAAAGEGTEE